VVVAAAGRDESVLVGQTNQLVYLVYSVAAVISSSPTRPFAVSSAIVFSGPLMVGGCASTGRPLAGQYHCNASTALNFLTLDIGRSTPADVPGKGS